MALWDWIEKREVNQREAAKLLGLPHVTVNHYLHNRRRPGLSHSEKIFAVTGIPGRLWLETLVAKQKTRPPAIGAKAQHLPIGNPHAR